MRFQSDIGMADAIVVKEPLICKANTDSIPGRKSVLVSCRHTGPGVDHDGDETGRVIRVYGDISIGKEPFNAGAA